MHTTISVEPARTPAARAAATPAFDPQLIRKYDGFGPRYTSYPTADRFHEGFGPEAYVAALSARGLLPTIATPAPLA